MHIGAHAGLGLTHGAQAAAVPPRLANAAHEFEAQLMKELMKPLTKGAAPGDSSDADDEDGEDTGLGSAGALGEFASEAMARALSDQGGFGIAQKIIAQLSARSAEENSHGGNDTEVSRAAGNKSLREKIKPLK